MKKHRKVSNTWNDETRANNLGTPHPERTKNKQSNNAGGRVWRVRGCDRMAQGGGAPKKRPTHRGTSLGMVSLAKRIEINRDK